MLMVNGYNIWLYVYNICPEETGVRGLASQTLEKGPCPPNLLDSSRAFAAGKALTSHPPNLKHLSTDLFGIYAL